MILRRKTADECMTITLSLRPFSNATSKPEASSKLHRLVTLPLVQARLLTRPVWHSMGKQYEKGVAGLRETLSDFVPDVAIRVAKTAPEDAGHVGQAY